MVGALLSTKFLAIISIIAAHLLIILKTWRNIFYMLKTSLNDKAFRLDKHEKKFNCSDKIQLVRIVFIFFRWPYFNPEKI